MKMMQKQTIPQKSITYFFLKSKDVNMENGVISVTLYAKLAREITFFTAGKKQAWTETFWVQMEDRGLEQVTGKVKALPNCMQTYEVSENIFLHLLDLAKRCPDELYGVTPYYVKASRQMFLPWQELEKCWRNVEQHLQNG